MIPLRLTSTMALAALAYAGVAQEAPRAKPSGGNGDQPALQADYQALAPVTRVSDDFVRLERAVPVDEAAALVEQISAEAIGGGEFAEVERVTDAIGMTHVTYQQTFEGIPVEGRRYVVHARGGEVQTVTGSAAEIPAELAVAPSLTPAAALDKALQAMDVEVPMWATASAPRGYEKPDGELVIFAHPKTGRTSLTYKFDVYSAKPLARAWVYVDAQSGGVVFENERLHHVDEVFPAESLFNGTVEVTGDRGEDGRYRLAQQATGGGVFTLSLGNANPFTDPEAYGNASIVVADSLPFSGNPSAVSAHWGAERTYEYYFERFGRRSYDDADAPLVSYVNAGVDYVNAFWDGQRMTYGDGDGVDYLPLTTLDVTAHELTHGVTEYSAGLVYAYESGALNESFSDIFGEAVQHYVTGSVDWLVGEEFVVEEGQALRSMSDPNAFGDPDTYLGDSWYLEFGDQGGVHINSGVMNYWYYLLVEGGTGVNDFGNAFAVEGIGHEKAAAIAYRNLTVYLGPFSEFYDARDGANQAAADLFGADSPEAAACAAAWEAVGVTGVTPDLACVEAPATVVLTVTTDGRGEETSWQVTGASSFPLFRGVRLTGNTTYVDTLALSPGEYRFRILDAVGDGFCCTSGEGSYTFSTLAGEVLATGSEFEVSEQVKLCVAGAPDTIPPTTPENFAAVDSTVSTVSYAWDPSTDDYGVAGYALFYQGRLLTTTTETSIRFRVPPEFPLTLGIVAYDAALNASGYVEATGTSLPAVIATGPVSTGDGEETVYACADPLDSTTVFIRANYEVSKGNLAYVIADDAQRILGATGNPSVSFAGFPAGTYYVWAFNYTGAPTLRRGDNVFSTRFSDGEYLISQNAVRVVRTLVDGGVMALKSGGDVSYGCLAGGSDYVGFEASGTSDANFLYVITDDANRIIGATSQGFRDFGGAPAGEYRIWGMSYTGDIIARLGDDAAAATLTDGCYDLSDNYVAVVRDSVAGGSVSSDGSEQVAARAGASVVPLNTTSPSASAYAYFTVDPSGLILQAGPEASVDLAGYPSGTYFVYGASYSGELLLGVGDQLYGSRVSEGCFELSANAVAVTYAGEVSIRARMVAQRTILVDVLGESITDTQPATVRVADALGRTVYRQTDVTRGGEFELAIPRARPGVHVVSIVRAGVASTSSVVVP